MADGLKGKRVLIVDDEAAVLFAYANLLLYFGIHTDCCTTGEKALELISANNYAAVVTDMRLSTTGSTEGLDIIRFLKKHTPEAKALVITGHGTREIKEEAFSLGADYYFEKPVDTNLIVGALKSLNIVAGDI